MVLRRLPRLTFSFALVMAGVCLGLVIALAVYQPRPARVFRDASYRAYSADLLQRLEEENEVLRQGVEQRRRLLATAESKPDDNGTNLSELERELARNTELAGLTKLEGSGLVIYLADGERLLRREESAENVIVHDYDLRDIINVLWAGGAEAISVNGERIVFSSYIYCVGGAIIVGDQKVSPPLEIHAIGEPETLLYHLESDPELNDLWSRAEDEAIVFSIEPRSSVECPAYMGSLEPEYARVGR